MNENDSQDMMLEALDERLKKVENDVSKMPNDIVEEVSKTVMRNLSPAVQALVYYEANHIVAIGTRRLAANAVKTVAKGVVTLVKAPFNGAKWLYTSVVCRGICDESDIQEDKEDGKETAAITTSVEVSV